MCSYTAYNHTQRSRNEVRVMKQSGSAEIPEAFLHGTYTIHVLHKSIETVTPF